MAGGDVQIDYNKRFKAFKKITWLFSKNVFINAPPHTDE